MAGSRWEKVGTIYNRVNGLLRSGALDPVERPLWFDIYRRFPPKVQPKYERPVPSQVLRQIIYPEDLIRLNFYKIYRDSDIVYLSNESTKTTSQLFVDKYIELLESEGNREDLFYKTAEILQGQGIRLTSAKTVKADKEEKSEEKKVKPTFRLSVKDIVGDIPDEKKGDHAKKVMLESLGLK